MANARKGILKLQEAEKIFLEVNSRHLLQWMPKEDPRYQTTLSFALNRVREGKRILSYLGGRIADGAIVLDLGSGNGGVSLPFAATDRYTCLCLDTFVHPELTEVVDRARLKVHALVASGQSIPLASGSVGLVLYLETIEHIDEAEEAGREISRVLLPGGLCLVSTPPRLRFLFRRDPHYDVFGLLCLPYRWQKWVLERLLRRVEKYEVTYNYSTLSEVRRRLSGLEIVGVTGPLSRTPLKHFDWEWILFQKPVE